MPDRFDVAQLGEAGRATGNPAAPLVRALTAAVEGDARAYVHLGATSQDVMDTACSIVSREGVAIIREQLDDACRYAVRLIDAYRDTPMVARTLGQQALPTTFGLRVAGWLDALLDARDELDAVPFAAQLGGAAGTLAALGEDGSGSWASWPPGSTWRSRRCHGTRQGPGGPPGPALAVTAGTLEKIAVRRCGHGPDRGGRGGRGRWGRRLVHAAAQAQPRGIGPGDRLRPSRARRGVDPGGGDGAGARAGRGRVAGRMAGGERRAGRHRRRRRRRARRLANWRSVPTACGANLELRAAWS